MIDLLLKSATIVDGTGAPSFVADVGVHDGRIVVVGATDEPAARTIECAGKVVCPGFIDIHTHYDAQLLWDQTASPSPLHGVTTVLGGNCGFSIAPLGPDHVDYVKRMMAVVEGMPIAALEGSWDWNSFGEYLDRIDQGLSVNAGFLVGHSAVRRVVMGPAATEGPATPEQVDAMIQLVRDALEAGALGFSSSLGEGHLDGDGKPVPSSSSTHDELLALSATLRDYAGTPLEFIPAIGPIPEDRVDIMADMSLAADRTLNWNLLGSLSPVEIYEEQLKASDVAAAKGARVIALTLPDLMRLRAGTVLPNLPGWKDVLDLDAASRRAAAADPEMRAKLRAGAEQVASRAIGAMSDFNLMEIADADSPYVGRALGDIAAERGTDVIDVLIDVVLPDKLTLYLVLPSLTPSLGRSEEGWRRRDEVWRDPRVVLGGSDAGAHLDLMCHANYPSVVLGEVVRDRGLLSIEEAVHLMTERPAQLYSLHERGVVAEGWHADLVVFDPTTIATKPAELRTDLPGGGERLYAAATGIEHVFVAGEEIVTGDEMTDARPGIVLRSGRDTA
jgi:N-acyl-D-aspartate/D-glutamate deacylase